MSESELDKLAIEPAEGETASRVKRSTAKRPVRRSMSPFADQPKVPESAKPARVTAKDKPGRKAKDPKRSPLGRRRAKLGYARRPGYERRWVNDEGSRVSSALQGGYDFVEENGEKVSRPVGTSARGGGQVAFLMEIPEEFYSDDFWEKQAKIDETDEQIMNGTMNLQPGDLRYVPKDGIKMTVRTGPGK